MKLIRYGEAGRETPGVIDNTGRVRNLSAVTRDISPRSLEEGLLDRLAQLDVGSLPLADGPARIGAPISRPGKLVCVGLNYREHANESGMAVPDEPVVFMKAPTSVTGPNDAIIKPPGSSKLDWEVELVAIIGRVTRRVKPADALGHVAGYCLGNDVSERAHQLERNGQWVKGKSHDTFAPLGPWLVTRDEIPDVQDLAIWLDVNGQRMQGTRTSYMLFKVDELVSYISHFMTLEPGDAVFTGTPQGVGLGRTPPVYLQAGDTLRLGIDGLGEQRHVVVDAE